MHLNKILHKVLLVCVQNVIYCATFAREDVRLDNSCFCYYYCIIYLFVRFIPNQEFFETV